MALIGNYTPNSSNHHSENSINLAFTGLQGHISMAFEALFIKNKKS
jgi:hypothetical protein